MTRLASRAMARGSSLGSKSHPRGALPGDIGGALERAGFHPTLLGDDSPPVTHYALEGDAGFYAEFLTPLEGGEFTRRGRRDVTVPRAGITAQKLRHLDILVAPWYIRLASHSDVVLVPPADVLLPIPVAFMMQKLLIQRDRRPETRAQDLLYIHDTLELFGGALEELRTVWRSTLRPAMSERTARRAENLRKDAVRARHRRPSSGCANVGRTASHRGHLAPGQ